MQPEPTRRKQLSSPKISKARLAAMFEEATVDAHDESEQATGWYTMIDENLELPFTTTVLGAEVSVTGIDIRADDTLVALCERGRARQAIPIRDLPLPTPRPKGSEWLEAYRLWLGDR